MLGHIAVPRERKCLTSMITTLKLDWAILSAHVRRRWLLAHRGELPARSAHAPPPAAPTGIAVCALFGQRHRFATEQEAETWRWVGSRALNVYSLWSTLRYEREDVRISIGAVRYWRQRGEARQAELGRAELHRRWKRYRRGMRAMAMQLAWVRQALTPRTGAGADALTRQAAE